MYNIIIIIMALAVSLFVVFPFFRGRRYIAPEFRENSSSVTSFDELKKLNALKETVYTVLTDIDFDFKMGKLSKADYDELSDKHKKEAVKILQLIDQVEERISSDQTGGQIEKEVAKVRGWTGEDA